MKQLGSRKKNGWIFLSIIAVVSLFMGLMVFLPLQENESESAGNTHSRKGSYGSLSGETLSGDSEAGYAMGSDNNSGQGSLPNGSISVKHPVENMSNAGKYNSVRPFGDITGSETMADYNSVKFEEMKDQNQQELERIQRELAESAKEDSLQQDRYIKSLEEQHKINSTLYSKVCGFLKENL